MYCLLYMFYPWFSVICFIIDDVTIGSLPPRKTSSNAWRERMEEEEQVWVASGKATVVVRCTCILGCCMSSHNMYMPFPHKGTHALMHNIAQLRASISLYHDIKLYRCQDMGMVRFLDTLSNLHVMVYQHLAYKTQKYMTLHPKHCTVVPFSSLFCIGTSDISQHFLWVCFASLSINHDSIYPVGRHQHPLER